MESEVVAILGICALVGLLQLDGFLFDSTRLGNVVGTLLLVPTLVLGCVLVLGRMTNDAN